MTRPFGCRWPSLLGLCLLVLLLIVGPSRHGLSAEQHGAAPRTIRVVMDNNYPPYIFLDDTGTVQGILADQWRLWQERTGIRVELTVMDWKDALDAMRAGRFDVIDTAFKTEERLGWLDYGAPHTRIEVAAFFHREISGIVDAASLKGFMVAVKEGDAAIDLLRSRGVDNLVLYKSYEAIVRAATEYKVNVFVIDRPPALYFLHKYGIQQSFKSTPPFNVGEFHRAVGKGNTALLAEIEAGFARISPRELEQIDEKWYGTPLQGLMPPVWLTAGLGGLGLLTLALVAWNRGLRAAVRRRTAELERSREDLRQSEARYRELVEQANSIILRMDQEGRILFLNEFAQRFFDYTPEEVLGRNVVGTIVPETDSAGQDLAAMIADIGLHPERYTANTNENMRRDGSRAWISWTNKPLGESDDEAREILCVGNDITERMQAEKALRRERERLEFIINGSRLGTWEWNVQSNETVFNETWAEMLGYRADELMPYSYATWARLLHPADLPRAEEALVRCVRDEALDYDCEFRMRHKDGHWVWILDRGRILTRDSAGKPLLMFGTHTDISSLKRVEEELLLTNELLTRFIKNSPIYAFIKEVTPYESRTLKASDNYEEMLGMPVAEMLGKTMDELFPAPLAASMTADDWRVASGDEILHVDEEFNGRSYTTIKFPIRLGERKLLAGYTIDLTEQRQAEAALQESVATFRNIVQSSPMGIYIYRLEDDGRLIFTGANPAADRLLGMDHSLFIGLPIEKAFPGLRETDIPEQFRRVVRSGESWQNGSVQYDDGVASGMFEVHAFRMAPGRLAVLFNDITDRRRAEEEREKLQAQLIQVQKMDSIGRLAGGVAHDFNNMLSVILGHCELALNRVDEAHPLYAGLENIRKAAERSAELTRQLLAFARKQTVAPRVIDLNETVAGMLDMLRRLIGEDIDLVWQPGEGLGAVRIDPSQLDQILVNLFVNARDAIGDTGKVTIETAAVTVDAGYCNGHADVLAGEYILLAVSDDGCGMDADLLAHLFEPFFTTKEMGKGTGLGLATVYGIVKQNGGFVNVYSEPGQGTTFKIYLPRHQTADQITPAVETAPAAAGTETILLVEDEPMILELTTAMLESLGYTVLAATGPEAALRLARDHGQAIHLLMTDVVMPGMNGRQLARELAAHIPDLACLFMSGYTANVIAHHGVLDQGVHFIQKPFTLYLLAAKVREALAAGDPS